MRYFLLPLFFLSSLLFAEASPVREHKVHEAFMTVNQSTVVLQAVPLKPPREITERIPTNSNKHAKWIPGYWSWSREDDRYVWVTGTWRVAPPGHEWVAGKWKHFDEGWVWLSGFWSPHAESDLSFIKLSPPDSVDEKVGEPPGDGYYWLPGHWEFNEEAHDFVWFMGRWQEFDRKWEYVPAHYMWREKGYVFIDGYWDWSLDERGTAYAAVEVPHDEIDTIAYMPRDKVEVTEIFKIYYPYWPDYYMTFHFWFFFHPDFDFGWGVAPVWWKWPAWWAFNGVDMWWLWWWWTHPGFPHPFFINVELAGMILPPGELILHLMQGMAPLPFIAPNGVIDIQDLVHAIEVFTGHTEPILPSSPEEVFQIQEEANPTRRPIKVLEPTAEEAPRTAPPKPFFGPSRSDFSQPSQRTPKPDYPGSGSVQRPRIEVVKPRPAVKPRERTYEGERGPQREYPQAPVRRKPPARYRPRTNTRPQPESYKPREYTPKPRYTPPTQQYKPRRTPESYKPQTPSKPQYKPRSQTAPHPTYQSPSKTPRNSKYNQLK